METRWTWLRAADTQAVRESRSSTERSVFHARRRAAVPARFGGVGEVERAMKPDFQCVRAHWIRGFIAFPKGRPAPGVMLMVSV
jgi:hypothetical protein